MSRIIFFIFITYASYAEAGVSFAQRNLQLAADKYQLHYEVNIEQRNLSASGVIRVINTSNENADHIPMRLYRLLQVSSLSDMAGKTLKFTQQVLSNEDWSVLQTNYIEIQLATPIKPKESYKFKIHFNGSLLGYSETGMNYVKDNISQDGMKGLQHF